MLDLLRISVASKEYVKVPVTAIVGGVPYDPTNDNVSIAFATIGQDPETSDFVAGSWETIGTVFYARVLLGPNGGHPLARGRYEMWLRIQDNPETPVLAAGQLEVI